MKILQVLGVAFVVIGLTFLVIVPLGLLSNPRLLLYVCPATGCRFPLLLEGSGIGRLGIFELVAGVLAVGIMLLLVSSAIGRAFKLRVHDSNDPRTRVID